MSIYLNYNGRLQKSGLPIIKADNRGLRYGDGLFETMKLEKGSIFLEEAHYERLFNGMHLMQFDIPPHMSSSFFTEQIKTLAVRNELNESARVRLMIFRGSGTLNDKSDHSPNYIIECTPLSPAIHQINEQGWEIGVYTDARKGIDRFSHLKTNNYLPYAMAAIYAGKQGWKDSLVVNTNGGICDSTIANIFIISKGVVMTPSLSEGAIAGVMRKQLLQDLPLLGYAVQETILSIEMIREAEEIFLTNSVFGLRWVKQFESFTYTNATILMIYDAIKRQYMLV